MCLLCVPLLMSSKCRKDPPDPPDCSSKARFADFEILSRFSNSSDTSFFNIENDTLFYTGNTSSVYNRSYRPRFRATKTAYDSVKWSIGTDPKVFTQPDFDLLFKQPEGQINVRLIAYKKPIVDCTDLDDGIDTMTKTFYLSSKYPDPKWIGSFKGYYVGFEKDTFRVKITYKNISSKDSVGFFIQNLANGGKNMPEQTNWHWFQSEDEMEVVGKYMRMEYGYTLPWSMKNRLKGEIKSDSLLFNFYMQNQYYQFKGRKVL
jgi:hypothetical protein